MLESASADDVTASSRKHPDDSQTHPEQDEESEDEASDCGVTADQETVEL